MARIGFSTSDRGAAGVPVSELASRAFAAAKLSMGASGYSHDDRLDCASRIVALILSDAASEGAAPVARCSATYCDGRSAGVRYVTDDHGASVPVPACTAHATRHAVATGETVPAYFRDGRPLATFGRMTGVASNFRRSLDRRRVAEAKAAATGSGFDAEPTGVAEARTALATISPEAAHAAARDALAALGLPRMGRAYPLAYAALRGTAERDALAELGIGTHSASDGAARVAVSKALSKARKAVPSAARWDFAGHLQALHLLDTGGVALKPRQSTRETGKGADMDALAPSALAEQRSAWDAAENGRELRTSQRNADAALKITHAAPTPVAPGYEPSWTRALPANVDRRLARAVELKRERAQTGAAADRAPLDAERGASYPVR